jgi:hypothetical protein
MNTPLPLPIQSALILNLLLILHTPPTQAVEQQRFTLDSYEDFAQGENTTTTLTATGTLTPAPTLTPLAEISAENLWAIVPDGDKHWIGTGSEGRLYLLTGKNTEATEKFQENFIHAIIRRQSGKINVATSPDGKIYELRGKDKPQVIFDPKAKYIWAMVCDKNDNLYIATGTDGIIYKLNPQNQSEIYYDSDETHIRTLAIDSQDRLFAGSANSGYLYHITAKDTAAVLAATGLQEVNSIVIADEHTLYFAAITSPQQSQQQNQPPSPPPPPSTQRNNSPSSSRPSSSLRSDNQRNKNAHLYSLDLRTLYPKKIWETEETIFTLALHNNILYIGTGPNGYLYTYAPATQAINRLTKFPAESITHILPTAAAPWIIGANNPTRLYHLNFNPSTSHIYTSQVFDAQIHSTWGQLRIHGSPTITTRTRSGNTPTPDKSWYPWTPTQNTSIQSPPARYIQFEATLPAGTQIDRIDLHYLNQNIAPQISQFTLFPPNVGFKPIPNPPQNPQPATTDQLFNYLSSTPSPPQSKPDTTRYQPEERRGLRTALWKASDPNGDNLHYTLHFRKTEETNSHLLTEKITDTLFSWDTSGWPDGRYLLTLTASDEPSNYKDKALSTTATSEPFYVDNTAPIIRINRIESDAIEFTVEEEASEIHTVTYSHNGSEFLHAPPIDGIIDSRRETFRVPREKDKPTFLRAEDYNGNSSSRLVEP